MRAISWISSRTVRLRRLAPADAAGLRWLQAGGGDRLTRLEAPRDADEMRDLSQAFADGQMAIERAHTLIGAALCRRSRRQPAPVAQPWDAIEHNGAPCDVAWLIGRGLWWRGQLDAADIGRLLAVARKGLVQEYGLAGCRTRIVARGYGRWRHAMAPAAYLQQVHAGGLVDAALTPWLTQGFVMRGFEAAEAGPAVVMVWKNRAR